MTTVPTPVHTYNVLEEVRRERGRQTEKFGEQNHPLTSVPGMNRGYGVEAEQWKFVNDQRVREGLLGWDSILLEEVYEALAETDPVKAREELLQCAAVCVAAIESLDRNELAGRRG